MTDTDHVSIEIVAERIRSATRVVALTGAGMSAPSGVPTFRGAGGLWRTFRAEDLATPDAFARDPDTVWEWYAWRRECIAACAPNAGHEVLARWCQERPGVRVVTQNVDGLHERAGTPDVLRLHGSIWHLRCVRGCAQGPSREDRSCPLPQMPPQCACGALLRPDVVWFGEPLDPEVLRRATALAAGAEVFLAIGTSSQVHPAAGLIPLARDAGALVVEINPDAAAPVGAVDVRLPLGADQALLALDARLGN